MKQPTPLNYVFGNKVSVAALFGLNLVFFYQLWLGTGNVVVCFGTLVAAVSSQAAHKRISEYRRWKKTWDGMSGEAPAIARRRANLRWALECFGAMVVLFVLTQIDYSEPGAPLFPVLFGIYFLVRLGWSYRQHRIRAPRLARRGRHKPWIVSVCLPPVRHSPSVQDAYRDLPDYCQRLLAPVKEARHGKAS